MGKEQGEAYSDQFVAMLLLIPPPGGGGKGEGWCIEVSLRTACCCHKLMVDLAPAIKPSYFLSTFVLHLISWLIKICLLGILCLKHLCKLFLMFAAFHFFSSSWIVIGFGLDCQSILKSGFGL